MIVDYRRATPEDSVFIKEVAGHSLVRRNNPDTRLFCHWLDRYMTGDNRHDGLCHTHFLVTCNGLAVGHVAEYLYDREVRHGNAPPGRVCYVGFDIHPDFWGRGIMKSALRRYIDDGFEDQRFSQLISECLTTNSRCRRLLEGLGFQSPSVGLPDQLWTMWKYKGLSPKARYGYAHEEWSNDSRQESAEGK
ncbi:GNAT family N-acetyltransferase [Thioalkalicoccus limnaeus]|uniref:GNAT family N-acetyltransferase n=1 Tax=Thioalkalicoccus limnaeus TaxID=120681 RepID=A0ABV4BEC4_9GAMM